MDKKFEIDFLSDAIDFLNALDEKARKKIYYNLRKAQLVNDPELFKKLTEFIWEFRTFYEKKYYRLLAFWDKTDKKEIFVLATNGFVKKSGKTPKNEIEKADKIRKSYFEQKMRDRGKQ